MYSRIRESKAVRQLRKVYIRIFSHSDDTLSVARAHGAITFAIQLEFKLYRTNAHNPKSRILSIFFRIKKRLLALIIFTFICTYPTGNSKFILL